MFFLVHIHVNVLHVASVRRSYPVPAAVQSVSEQFVHVPLHVFTHVVKVSVFVHPVILTVDVCVSYPLWHVAQLCTPWSPDGESKQVSDAYDKQFNPRLTIFAPIPHDFMPHAWPILPPLVHV